MKVQLWHNYVDDELRYFWWIDNIMVSPLEGHPSRVKAEWWYINSDYYQDLQFTEHHTERRYNNKSRRGDKDRRDRVSIIERRQTPGRRWIDQLH